MNTKKPTKGLLEKLFDTLLSFPVLPEIRKVSFYR